MTLENIIKHLRKIAARQSWGGSPGAVACREAAALLSREDELRKADLAACKNAWGHDSIPYPPIESIAGKESLAHYASGGYVGPKKSGKGFVTYRFNTKPEYMHHHNVPLTGAAEDYDVVTTARNVWLIPGTYVETPPKVITAMFGHPFDVETWRIKLGNDWYSATHLRMIAQTIDDNRSTHDSGAGPYQRGSYKWGSKI